MTHIAAFVGSPRVGGNTETLVGEVLRGASEAGAETTQHALNKLSISPCQGCDACRQLGTHDLSSCTVYASSEPCPMCLGALFWARVARIVYAVDRAAAAEAGFDDAFFYEQICGTEAERAVPVEHRPEPEARRVMEAWARRADRRAY